MTIQGKRGMATSDQRVEAEVVVESAGGKFVPIEQQGHPAHGKVRKRAARKPDAPLVKPGEFVLYTDHRGEFWPALVTRCEGDGVVCCTVFSTKSPEMVMASFDAEKGHRSWCLPMVEAGPVAAKKPAKKAAKKKA